MWQHVGGGGWGWEVYSSLVIEVQSPLTEMFAQLKHHLLRHIAEGCQRHESPLEKLLIFCVQEQEHPLCFHFSLGVLFPLLTYDGVEI